MRHPNPNLMTKLDTYRKALVKEFIKELKHISEVKAGRAAKKPDFSDEIINLGKSFGINALSNVGLPGMSLAANSLEIVVDWANEQRSKTKIEHLDAQYQETTKRDWKYCSNRLLGKLADVMNGSLVHDCQMMTTKIYVLLPK
ncbi:MAG: hypothetical protein HWD59_00405 [Coxiellaceae bacterium]|nr:MAG: hypothetical protein HWD59_00405 [Coxiellaceae bacterium]